MERAQNPNQNTRIYAIGDIHGRLDLLDRVIAAIHRDVEVHGPGGLTVTLGDYIDRGLDSRGVLDRLAVNPFPTSYIALKANHESMLEAFLADPALGRYWGSQGGEETLRSYDVLVRKRMRSYEAAADRLRAALPAAHVSFLQSLKTSLSHGKYFFCHAGVRPGIPLERQSDEDLLWIRDEFLDSKLNFGKVVIHGHTPVPEPEVRPNRINVDTGAFATGRLTCVALDEDGHRFLNFAD
jgi:diadenosine tetraphosphatase ApaH/serine/threonine PP2A family protein phosphatase